MNFEEMTMAQLLAEKVRLQKEADAIRKDWGAVLDEALKDNTGKQEDIRAYMIMRSMERKAA